MITFQEMIRRLTHFWEQRGCVIHQGYDLEVGAGTSNPATFLRCLGPEPYKAVYIEPSRRPTDGRYGTHPSRLQHYFQCQVILKPSPPDIQDLCLQSLEAIGFNLAEHDMRFVHDDWENPTLGAWGLGWEVWMDGMEVTQFTYFQSVAGQTLKPITGEVTYGLERLAMYLQKVDSIYDLQYNDELTYGDIYQRNEIEWSHYNFEHASTEMWFRHFQDYEKEAKRLMELNLPLAAYDFVLKCSHAFNILDARGAISVTERTGYIGRIRDLSKLIAESYLKTREQQNFPLLKYFKGKESIAMPHGLPPLDQELLDADPAKHEDFLLEIGSEELPATFVPIGCQNLEKSIKQLLDKEGIPYKEIKTFGTPRRLAVYVSDMAMGKPSQQIEKRGPSLEQIYDPSGKPTQAGQGFFRSINKEIPALADLKAGKDPQLQVRQVKGVDYVFALLKTDSRPTADILSEHLPNIILNLDFPKKMRWGNLDITYARPLRWIVALLGKHVIPFVVGDILSGRESCGHRQLRPFTFSLVKSEDYTTILKEHRVLVDIVERKKEIVRQLDALEKTLGGKIIARDQVIPQVLHLVEWPQVTTGTFDKAFLKAPKEVLISEMVEHQKYFPVADMEGTLKNIFVITADNTPTDQIRSGNQKALSPRLSDGVFLYEQDLKTPLETFNEKLKNVTFQKELGNVYEKVERITKHAELLQKALKISSPDKVARASHLCKADLASAMVYEFPELQGTIGRYYATAAGEYPEVAQAIEEHWMPRGENSPLPRSETGIVVSLAEKIDNLIGCFCANLKPTSSSDPYALRRQVLGIIKILIAGKYRLPIHDTFRECFKHFPERLTKDQEQLLKEIEAFFINRIKTVFVDYGFSKDEIEAAVSLGFTDIYDAFCKVQALHEFRSTSSQFPLLFEVYKRAKGQLNNQASIAFNPVLLKENAEKKLDEKLNITAPEFDKAITARNYDQAYEMIAHIQPYIATLFEEVKILDDNPQLRDNRIALLQRVFGLFERLLDFSKIQE